jgi:hypothetical protein
LIEKSRKDTHEHSNKGILEPTLYRSGKQKQEAKTESAEGSSLGWSRLQKERPNKNSEIKDELNTFNLSDKIMKYKSLWKNHVK